MTLIEELGALPDRIKASQARLNDLAEQLHNERQIRDALIVQAVDQAGMSQADVARAAGLSQPQIVRILAASSA